MHPSSASLPVLDDVSLQPSGPETVLRNALETLQHQEDNPLCWLEVAIAFRAAGQPIQAIEACEACLKLDSRQLEAWFLIANLALAVGHREIGAEALSVIRELAPADDRIADLAARM
ncbi:MAG TPA: tetratricopeptide repeat protein [Opitutaceae bacterium]